MQQKYAISTTASEGDFDYLVDIPVTEPQSDYKPFSKVQELGNGGARLAGWPTVIWHWNAITQTERAALQAFCPNGYADNIYINTLDNNNEWITARTTMFWTQEAEQWSVDKELGLTLLFKIKSIAIVD